MEEFIEQQLLIWGRAFSALCTIKESYRGPQEKLLRAVCCAGLA